MPESVLGKILRKLRRRVSTRQAQPAVVHYQPFNLAVKYRPIGDGQFRPRINERIVEVPFVFRSLSSLPAGAAMLELGCAQSYLAISLASIGYKVWAVDLMDYDLTHPKFRFLRGDFLDQKFDLEFDAFIAVSVIEHAGLEYYGDSPRERADCLIMRKVASLLRDKGIAIVTVPFGIPTTIYKRGKPFQRIYDAPQLSQLFEGFHMEEERYYFTHDHLVWQEGTQATVAQVDNSRPNGIRVAAGVACVKAVKE